MDKICCIVGACAPGNIILPDQCRVLVIAADGGLSHLEAQGIGPDLVVGDFDSLGRVPTGENISVHPVEKDDTDTMLAVRLGMERGCRTFVVYGGLGGRMDHTYANFQTLGYLAERGARGYLVRDGWVCCAVNNDAITFPAGLSGTISVFCPNGSARGVDLSGLYYSLSDGVLESGFPLGVSNHFTGEAACVSVREGMLLLMWEETAESLVKRL